MADNGAGPRHKRTKRTQRKEKRWNAASDDGGGGSGASIPTPLTPLASLSTLTYPAQSQPRRAASFPLLSFPYSLLTLPSLAEK